MSQVLGPGVSTGQHTHVWTGHLLQHRSFECKMDLNKAFLFTTLKERFSI